MQIAIITLSVLGAMVIGVVAVRRLERMSGKSFAELRAYLRSPEWVFYRNALKELRKRGEDIKPEIVLILELLISETKTKRTAGWLLLKDFYPEIAARVADYKPLDPQEVCREKMHKIFLQETLRAV